jgi:undecaprenyl-diphosphatase
METFIEWDKKLFVALNGMHHPVIDPVMYYLSDKYIWIPLYLFLLFIILKEYRNDSWAPLLGILIMIVLSDQINTSVLKPLVQRLRPTHDMSLKDMVHIVHGYTGGKFGFASSHASNTFALATFFWVLFREKRKWVVSLFLWAVLVSYSRIYLGVHFPGDVIVGIIIGVLSALLGLKVSGALLKWSYKRRESTGATK